MSDNITKRVGLGTAYGFAKAGGYEGTVAEFTELLGNIAIDLARIENLSVTVTTLPAGSQATASLNGSVLSLGIPKGDKGDKGNTGDTGAPAGFGTVSATVDANIGTPSVEVTASGADTAKNFAFAFHNLKGQKGDKGDTGEVSEAELAEALEDFSANGTVASAEQLTTDIRTNDQTPYLFRTSGGSVDIGDREYINGIVGGTVAWNQLVNNVGKTTNTDNGITFTVNADGSVTLNGTATADATFNYGRIDAIKNHKYAVVGIPSGASSTGHKVVVLGSMFADTIRNISASDYWTSRIIVTSGTTVTNVRYSPLCIDLTQMFGSTIADYIYSLEQANAGAGVAWFRKLFPKPYYAYNSGELKSVKGLVSHDMVGFNAFDKSTATLNKYIDGNGVEQPSGSGVCHSALIRVVPNTTYYTNASATSLVDTICLYDENKNFIKKLSYSAPTTFDTENASYVILNTASPQTSIDNLVLNLSWDGSEDGNYEPYQKWSYPLDSDLELRGIPKIENGNLYYDGDVYEADGTVTRKYGIVIVDGSEPWIKSSSYNGNYYFAIGKITMRDAYPKNGTLNIVTSNGLKPVASVVALSSNDLCILIDGGTSPNINIKNTSKTTLEEFKTWLASNPIALVYELATPTTETADPYNRVQAVYDFGTEEFVISNTIDVPIPVGNNTDYPINLKAKLEMAPNSPSQGNGDYIVRQTNGMNEYVPLVIEDALPTIPSTAGSYKLTVTVTEGSDPVLSWTAE